MACIQPFGRILSYARIRRRADMSNDASGINVASGSQDASRIKDHRVVSHGEWLSARTAFLAREKDFTRLRDELSRERRDLPWEVVDKEYVFEGPDGKETLR